MDIILALVEPLAEWTVTPIWRHLNYVFHYKSNIEYLTGQVHDLRDKREGVHLEVTDARRALMEISPGVDRWLGDADNIILEEEKSFSEETVAAKAACCKGWLPNLKCRHSLGRKAVKMTEKVDKLLAKDLGIIAHSAPPAQVEFQPTEDPTQLGTNSHEGASSSGTSTQEQPPAYEGNNISFDSRRSIVRDVMKALRGSHINPIILCGMGGIGKTTLMGQVFQIAKGEGLFDEYTKATIKESLDKAPDLSLIQDELARYLGMPLEGREIEARSSKLRQRLSQSGKKILVMLDNVSTTTPDFLWDIGIPPSCKLLVTSRQQDLFKDMNTRKNFPLHGLPDTEAWSLFKKRAGSSIETDSELYGVAKKVLEECAGLPVAISTVGTALKGESIGIWKNALRELEKANPKNVPGVIEHVYGKIKFSYECLPSEEAKSCFLLCSMLSMFGGIRDIAMEDLVRYGVGLGLFKDIDSMAEVRNLIETLVRTLKSRFLLLDRDTDDFALWAGRRKMEYVIMHDVVHDVAVHIASEKAIIMPETVEILRMMEWPISEESVVCMSLIIGGRCELLQLLSGSLSLEPPRTAFERMDDLKVLYFGIMSKVPSLAVLQNLHTLCLHCCNKDDVSEIGEIRTLMILDLSGSQIEQLPETFKNLSNLRLLDLSGCRWLKMIPPGVLSGLSLLEELYMWDSFKNWEAEKLASLETTNWISQLEAEERPEYFFMWKITTIDTWKRLNQLAVEQPEEVGEKFRYEVQSLMMKADDRDEYTRWANSMDWETGILAELLSLSCLTSLEVVLPPVGKLLTSRTSLFNKLEKFKISIGWKEHLDTWHLEHEGNYLRVDDFDASAGVGVGFTLLLQKTSILEFKVKNLTEPQLLNVLSTICFAKMKSVKLENCDDVEYLTDTTLVNTHGSISVFPVLSSLEISEANRLKEIFHGELPAESLKELRRWTLNCLPALTYIWKTRSQSEWGLLRNILGLVEVIRIESCKSLEEIVAFEDDEEEINFKSATELCLIDLPSFSGISKNISKWPERQAKENSCPEQSDADAGINPLFDTRISDMWWMRQSEDFSSLEQSDPIIPQPLFDTRVHFPVLRFLVVVCMNLKEIWNSQVSAESFYELQSLMVTYCHILLHLVPTHMQNRFQKLEKITVRECSSLLEIFEHRQLSSVNQGAAAALTISDSGNQDQGTQINKMIRSPQAFQNLSEISIKHCDSLRTVFSSSIAKGLVKLQTLKIKSCKEIEEIVAAAAEGEETEDDNMFPQLCTLTLKRLPNIGSFSQGKYDFNWPLVEHIRIYKCCKMHRFCSGSLSTSKEVKIHVADGSESLMQELNNLNRSDGDHSRDSPWWESE